MKVGSMRCIIVDDESSARRVLRNLCKEFCPDVEIIGEADSADVAYALIQKESPDFIFLDIRMPIKDGFQLLGMFDEIEFKVIFTTAFDQYAVQAFRFSALDYLLKPIDIDELVLAVKKVKKSRKPKNEDLRLGILRDNMNIGKPKKVALPTSDGYVFMEEDNIIRCEAYGNYTKVFQSEHSRPILVTHTLKHFEGLLAQSHFFRVHKSYLVNLKHVKRFIKGKPAKLVMSDHSQVEVSIRKKDLLVERLVEGL